jgi:transposase
MAYLFKKVKNGKAYWYVGENKRINGVSKRVWQKYVGPADKIADELAYGVIPKEIDVLDFGLCSALQNINDNLNFVDIVNKIIPKREQGLSYGEHLLITLMNRIDNPKSRNKLGDWFDSTFLKRIYSIKKDYLSSQNFWNHWNHITDENVDEIQEELLKVIAERYDITDLCYDPTNFTTYTEEHKNQKIMQFGHSKDERKGLRQVNLSLLVTKKDGIPLWHHAYNGNINDVTEFKEFIKAFTNKVSILSKKCEKITLIIDKGNNGKNNIKNINKKLSFFVVGSLKPSEYEELFDIPLEEFIHEYKTTEGKKVFCVAKNMDVYEGKKKVVITYSSELAYKNKIRVDKALNKALNQLKNIQGKLKKSDLSRDELVIKVSSIADKQWIKGLIDYEIFGTKKALSLEFKENDKAYDEKRKGFGKNILFTDDLSLKITDIVKIYNSKNIIEEQFKNFKNPYLISFTPMWCWTDQMIKIHAFTCVLALLFLRMVIKKAEDNNIKLSQDKIIYELKKIKLTLLKMPNRKEIQAKITRLNDNQRVLANVFEIRKYA